MVTGIAAESNEWPYLRSVTSALTSSGLTSGGYILEQPESARLTRVVRYILQMEAPHFWASVRQ